MERHALPRGQHFNINSPGGGMDEIEEYVIIPLRVKGKQETQPEQGYADCEAEVEEVTINMKFGVCARVCLSLCCGVESKCESMDRLLDYHAAKTVAMTVEEKRIILPSTSWMAATMEMRDEAQGKCRKAYVPFLPSQGRLANMVMSGRKTINMAAILYPGRDNIVRVGRHNVRVDEGYRLQ
jgi:hypothetical protein